MKGKELSTQEYLSLGYIYLLILGIFSDTIYYHFLGINILNYSSFLDVLISPIALLTSNVFIPIIIVFSIGLMYYTNSLGPKIHRASREKKWYQKMYDVEKLDQKYANPPSNDKLILISGGLILFFYIGIGVGKGFSFSEKIKNGDFEPDHHLIFQDKEELEVKIVGQNSIYLFYTVENGKELIISPIEQNIKMIKEIEAE